ncbi:MAG: FAD-binding oxidoreductase [Planctomycetota bacterium]
MSPGSGIEFSPCRVTGWGMAVGGTALLARATCREHVEAALERASSEKRPLCLRGSGCSYGDANTNTDGLVLDTTGMKRILSFDPLRGLITVEPGVTIRELWRHVIPYGFWPAVVPGTMEVSAGGAAAMNIHGKNHFAVGTFGEQIASFSLLTPRGDVLRCSPDENADVYRAAIGGFGMLGCFLEITLRLKRVHSGRLRVFGIPAKDLGENLRLLEDLRGKADYLVSWIDLCSKGAGLGRGLLHRADQLEPGEDPKGLRFFDPVLQDVPSRLFGVVPKGWLWPGMWLATHCGGVPLVNAMKYGAGYREARHSPYLQTHGAFHFLLDYVPRWQWMTKPGGLIQFQPFVPVEQGEKVLARLIERCHAAGHVPYLGVLKRHRPDPFLMTYSLDGYSLAMDFAVSVRRRRREALWKLCREMAEIVLDAGGRFYYAKDAILPDSAFARVHGDEAVAEFRALKAKLDPESVLQSDLSRRLSL